jgi:hypothetical protein
MDDLNYLQEYLSINHNLDVKIKKSDNIFYIKNINIIILILVILLILLFIIFFYFKLDIKSLIAIIILLFFIQKYFFMVYHYYNNLNKYENNCVKYDINNLETGDILQESINWDNKNGFLTFYTDFKFLHNIFVIKFNNNLYGLHYVNSNFGYPENIISFKSKHIEIFELDKYFIDNYYYVKYYRLFKIKEKLNNDLIFNFIKTLDMEKLFFSYYPNTNEKHIINNTNKYHCLSFILNLLNYCNIIPKLNYQNFMSDDLIFLTELSNFKYKESIIIKL